MVRISAVFIAICMVLIAGSLGAALFLQFNVSPVVAAISALGALIVMAFGLYVLGDARAQRIYDGGGYSVSVRLAGQPQVLPGDWRMLGTSSAFVFVWDADGRRAEVLPIDSVEAVQLLGWRPRTQQPQPQPAPAPAPAQRAPQR